MHVLVLRDEPEDMMFRSEEQNGCTEYVDRERERERERVIRSLNPIISV